MNYVYFLGYDKLKPYGFPIHGAIDGYSRKILWLEVARSNSKPENVARFYLDCVKENGGCPILLRSDCGTENGVLAGMQCYFRQNGQDEFAGEKAHKYGSSPANQQLRLGGLISGEVEQVGGSTFLRTWSMLEYWT